MIDATSVSSTLGLVQQVIKLGKKATNLQYEEALLAAREGLFSQRESILNLSEEISLLKQKIKEHEDTNELSEHIEFWGGAYWLDDGSTKVGPNCTSCWVDRNKLLRLDLVNMGSVYMSCPSCKATYGHTVKRKYQVV